MLSSYSPKRPDWAAILFVALMVVYVVLLISCTTQRKAIKYFDGHGFEGAEYCASRYPIDTFFKKGEFVIDTLIDTIPGKLIPIPSLDHFAGISKMIGCPTSMIITIKKHRIDTAGMVSEAKYKALQGKIGDLQAELASKSEKTVKQSSEIKRLRNGRDTWRWIGICGIGIIAAGLTGWIIGKSKLL